MEWKKIFVNHIPNTKLICRICRTTAQQQQKPYTLTPKKINVHEACKKMPDITNH